MTTVDYTPAGEVLSAFLRSDASVRFIMGPFGSGKSVACAIEVFRRACQQAPGPDKVRRSRWMVLRSTYPQLRRTTIPTWQQWFDDRFGAFTWGPPPRQRMVLPLEDGTVVDLDVQFVGLDGPTAEADLRGFEGTGIWLNEVSEIPFGVLAFARGRIGRYPSKKDGGPSWYGIIGDTNPPDSDSWYYRLAEEEQPEGWEFFKQPGGVIRVDGKWIGNPDAENLKHLPLGYYEGQLSGQSEDWIKVYLGGEYGFVQDGKPVYPEWSDSAHVAQEPLKPVEGLSLFVGLDFGLTPAAVFGQRLPNGRWLILDELVAEDMGVIRYSENLGARIAERFAGLPVEAFGDPAGTARSQTDERTCIQIVEQYANIPCRPAPTNQFSLRREAVAMCLNRMVDGKPAFQLDPRCKVLRKGFAGGYAFRRVQVSGDERYQDKADKNRFSHPHDALQYLLSGAGEARVVMRDQMSAERLRNLDPTRQGRVRRNLQPNSLDCGWMGG